MHMNDLLRQAMENAAKAADERDAEQPTLTVVETQPEPVEDELEEIDYDEPEPTPAPAPVQLNVKGLDEKAVLVSVKRRMYSPYKLDKEESEKYGAGNVNKHLFEGRDNKVKETISKFTAVYTWVKDNTVPWSTGVDMLNINHYFEFNKGLRERIEDAEKAVEDLYRNWDREVQADLARLMRIATAKGKPSLANINDYPDAEEMRSRFGIDVRYMPVPTTGDFRVGISDEDKASLQRQLEEAESNAARHVIQSMLEPMQRAAEKLSVPIGKDGAVFRDTLIDNMVDVAERMAKVNLSDDSSVLKQINDLKALVGAYANNKDVLRQSPVVRNKAASQIKSLVNQMQGLV